MGFRLKIQTRFLLLFLHLLALVPNTSSSEQVNKPMNPIFQHGEELVYEVAWMGITAGTIRMQLINEGDYEGKPAYRGIVIGETSASFSRFFKVQDVIISIFSQSTLDSIFFSKNIREGKYRKYRETHFDQLNHIAKSDRTSTEILPNAKDPIACIFALRDAPLEPGYVVHLNSHADGKNYPVAVKVESRESVKLQDVTRSAFVCTPIPTWEGRVFEKGRSSVTLWISDDEYHVPLKIKMKVKIGSLHASLIGRSGPGWVMASEKPL